MYSEGLEATGVRGAAIYTKEPEAAARREAARRRDATILKATAKSICEESFKNLLPVVARTTISREALLTLFKAILC